MPKVIRMPRRTSVQLAPRKETPPQDGVTSVIVPAGVAEQDTKLRQYEKLAEIALSKPLEEESA